MERKIKYSDRQRQYNPISELTLIKNSRDLDFADDHFIQTMKVIEKSHCEYLDVLSKKHNLPRLNFYAFMENLFTYLSLNSHIQNVKIYYRNYDKFKKSLPTAGGIILNDNYILLIKMHGTKIYSLPKGKAEEGELPFQTAIREIQEETGLKLEGVLTPETDHITVYKTKLYIIECDSRIRSFSGYNSNEIAEIRWFNMNTVVKRSNLFSKQTRAVVNKLFDMNY